MQRYLVFILVGSALLMSSIDATVVSVALPSFMGDLHANVLWAGWTISLYFIAVAIAMPLMGNLSDNFGRKNVFLFCLLLFTGSSVACGLAPNIYALIVFRFFQGIGGAGFLPTASGIVSDYFPESRERAIGLFSSIFPIGGIIGPNLGGWIVSRFSWRDIFFVNLPIGLVLLAACMVLLKRSGSSSRRRIDIGGAFFFSGTVLFLMFGLNFFAESLSGTYLLLAGLCLVFSLSLALAFFFHERGHSNPILDLELLQSKPFLAANVVNFLIGAGALGVLSFIPLYATSVHRLSTMMSGMIMTPRSFGMISASAVTSFMLGRSGYRRPMVWGFAIVAFSTMLLVGTTGIRSGHAVALSLLMLFSGVGSGIALPASNNACIELMPQRVATIVGLRGMFRTIGAAMGVSFITFVLHTCPDNMTGFNIAFLSCGLGLLSAIPLVFLMPSAKGRGGPPGGWPTPGGRKYSLPFSRS